MNNCVHEKARGLQFCQLFGQRQGDITKQNKSRCKLTLQHIIKRSAFLTISYLTSNLTLWKALSFKQHTLFEFEDLLYVHVLTLFMILFHQCP